MKCRIVFSSRVLALVCHRQAVLARNYAEGGERAPRIRSNQAQSNQTGWVTLGETDLLPSNATTEKLVKSVFEGENGHEEEAIHRAADSGVSEGSAGWGAGQGAMP